MNLETKPDSSLFPDAVPATLPTDWNEHEHVSDQVQLEARKLVDLVGSTELAKNAIDVIGQSQSASPGDNRTPGSPTILKRNEQFLKALEVFETALETPVMAGELIGWTTTVNRACEQLGVLLRNDVQREHAALYATIAKQDSELSSRVEKLRKTDEQLALVDFENVQCGLKQLCNRAEVVEQDEAKTTRVHADALKQALAFVIAARTQETAITAWFGEAFNRESGFGD
jgi:hypothetical protein